MTNQDLDQIKTLTKKILRLLEDGDTVEIVIYGGLA
jgi:hypothetical protein